MNQLVEHVEELYDTGIDFESMLKRIADSVL